MNKPKQIKIVRWDCGNGHKHKTEQTAARCLARSNYEPESKAAMRARWIHIARTLLEAQTHKEAAAELGISTTRAAEITRRVLRAVRMGSSEPLQHSELSLMSVRSQRDYWLKQIDRQAKEWAESGQC